MRKTVLRFGLMSAVLSSAMMLAMLPVVNAIGLDKGAIAGYTAIVLSFLLVFFGIRSYRENVGAGAISFGRAFAVGILITLLSCAGYVATWEVIYFRMMPDFGDKYTGHVIARLRASGASPEAIDAKVREMEAFKVKYNQPLYNAAITFTEPFPIGLLVTVISSAVLRKKGMPQARV